MIADLIPNSELAVVSGAAHGFMIEHWTTFNSILLDFLGRAERLHRSTRPVSDALERAG
jgi:hypothetical protein